MEIKIVDIKLNFNLNESRLMSYCSPEEEDRLILNVITKDLSVYQFVFSEVILFVEWGWDIASFCLNKSNTVLYLLALEKNDISVPESTEKLYQFLDSAGQPSIEIACASFDYKLI